MSIDPIVLPGLLLFGLQVLVLAALGYVVARVALRQTDHSLALAQGLIIGPALWGLVVNFVLHLLPGLSGALAGWIITLALGASLAWRGREDLQLPPRTLAGFSLAGAAVFWIALASRQLLIIPDGAIHTTLPASIRAGSWPPTLSWNPDLKLAYHHGIDLLVALLTPPTGPDLAFTTELLGAYAWTALILLAATLLMRRGSRVGTLVLLPLLLAPGAWTLVFGQQPTLLQVPLPADVPSAGLRATFLDLYWPAVELPWPSEQHAVPPNIWKPQFSLAYAMAFVALERAVCEPRLSWPGVLVLAGLIGFLGLVDETVAAVVLVLWAAALAFDTPKATPTKSARIAILLRASWGPALAALTLAGGGSAFTGLLTQSAGAAEISLAWPSDPRSRGAVSSWTTGTGGLGILGLGSMVVILLASLLAWRSRLVLFLAAGSLTFLVAALILRYEAAPHDLGRLDGHARNFALVALMLALGQRLSRATTHTGATHPPHSLPDSSSGPRLPRQHAKLRLR